MRRWALVVAMVALVATVAGCGSSSGGSSEESSIPSAIQLRLGIGAQQQLRTQLRDRSIEVTDVRCGAPAGDVTSCTLTVVDSKGRRGTFGLGVRVDRKVRRVQLGWTGTSNRYWRAIIERQSRGRRGQQGRQSRGIRRTSQR